MCFQEGDFLFTFFYERNQSYIVFKFTNAYLLIPIHDLGFHGYFKLHVCDVLSVITLLHFIQHLNAFK
jgi:hypothetical protein